MRPEDILLYVRAQPFRPFRIVMNSGRTFDIRHPEMIRVGRTSMHIFTFAGEVADPLEALTKPPEMPEKPAEIGVLSEPVMKRWTWCPRCWWNP